MRWTGVVAIAVAALAIPAMAFAQAEPSWCGGSYGSEGTNFGPCQAGMANPQVAGQASGVQAQSVQTQPQYPSSQVTFRDGRAYANGQELQPQLPAVPGAERRPEPGRQQLEHLLEAKHSDGAGAPRAVFLSGTPRRA